MEVSMMFQGCFNDILKEFQGRFKKVSKSFKGDSRELQGYVREVQRLS